MIVRRRILSSVVSLAVLATVTGAAFAADDGAGRTAGARTAAARPNIVFVLTDDLAWNLVRYMPHVQQLQRQGVTFRNYVVSDSLCCPSRSSIFTGLFPHDTHVLKNKGPLGGYHVFRARGLERRTYATAIQLRGYRTSMMGKYLNGYQPTSMHIPPGWNDWHVAGTGYPEFNYDLLENGTLNHYDGPWPACTPTTSPDNYLTDVLAARGSEFISQSAAAHKPFAIEIATFAPHSPYTPAPRNACDFPGLRAPRDASFNRNNVNPPRWLGPRAPLTPAQLRTIDTGFRMRAQSVEAVDRLVGQIETTLAATGQAKNTYIVFSSDNGYHMGEHRLLPGKQTAFDTDIRVPLIVAGPGVPRGRTVSQIAQNVDLYPTFLQLAGRSPSSSIDGHSLVPLLEGRRVGRWRTAALVEHHGPGTSVNDPDFENGARGGNPTTYEAIRLANSVYGNAVYVEYVNGEREYYRIDRDPSERTNVYRRLNSATRARLHAIVAGLSRCHGASRCWAAGQPH